MAALVAAAAARAAGRDPGPLGDTTIELFDTSPEGRDWPGWGPPTGPARRVIRLDVITAERGHAGRLIYQNAFGHAMLPVPDRLIVGRPTRLKLRVRGDGSSNLLSANLIDSSGEWFNVEPLAIDFTGWRSVTLDLTRFRSHARGNDNGYPEPPISLYSVNIEFTGRSAGELLLDDLSVEQTPFRTIDYLELAFPRAGRSGLYLPEDGDPLLAVFNHSESSVTVRVGWRAGAVADQGEVTAPPAGQVVLPFRLPAPGAYDLEVTLDTGDGVRRSHEPIILLPAKIGPPDTFAGLGSQELGTLNEGYFAASLPLLRAAGAGWSVLEITADDALRSTAGADVLALAWAQGLRMIAHVDAGVPEPSALAGRAVAENVAMWWLSGPPATTGDDDARATELARRLAAMRQRLGARPAKFLADLGYGVLPDAAQVARWWQACGRAPDELVVTFGGEPGPAPPGAPYVTGWLSAAVARGGGHPVRLFDRTWPLELLTGIAEPSAALAVALTVARATPGLNGVGWGELLDRPGVRGLVEANGRPRPELIAWAVNARLVGGLECQGLSTLAASVYVTRFSALQNEIEVAWSEGQPYRFEPPAEAQTYDHLGRLLAPGPLDLTAAPVYVVSSGGSGGTGSSSVTPSDSRRWAARRSAFARRSGSTSDSSTISTPRSASSTSSSVTRPSI